MRGRRRRLATALAASVAALSSGIVSLGVGVVTAPPAAGGREGAAPKYGASPKAKTPPSEAVSQ